MAQPTLPATGPLVTVDRVVRGLAQMMGPHVRHQSKWEARDGGAIWCRECERMVVDVLAFKRLGILLLDADGQARARDAISRWLAAVAEPAARLTFPIHKPDRLVVAKRITA